MFQKYLTDSSGHIVEAYVTQDTPIIAKTHAILYYTQRLPLIESVGEGCLEIILNAYYSRNIFHISVLTLDNNSTLSILLFAYCVKNV